VAARARAPHRGPPPRELARWLYRDAPFRTAWPTGSPPTPRSATRTWPVSAASATAGPSSAACRPATTRPPRTGRSATDCSSRSTRTATSTTTGACDRQVGRAVLDRARHGMEPGGRRGPAARPGRRVHPARPAAVASPDRFSVIIRTPGLVRGALKPPGVLMITVGGAGSARVRRMGFGGAPGRRVRAVSRLVGRPVPRSRRATGSSGWGGGGGVWSMKHAAAWGAPTRFWITRTTSTIRVVWFTLAAPGRRGRPWSPVSRAGR